MEGIVPENSYNIFHNITILLYFRSNKYSLGEHEISFKDIKI